MISRVQEDVAGREIAMQDASSVAVVESHESLAYPAHGQVRWSTDTGDDLILGRTHHGDVGRQERDIEMHSSVEHAQNMGTL